MTKELDSFQVERNRVVLPVVFFLESSLVWLVGTSIFRIQGPQFTEFTERRLPSRPSCQRLPSFTEFLSRSTWFVGYCPAFT